MAYIKYKELTEYFNFHQELDINNLPDYVKDYLSPKEEVFVAYATNNDKFVLTNKKILIFDVKGITGTKKIHIFPFKSISSSAIEFKANKTAILVTMDSGYQLRLNFVQMNPKDKRKFRQVYMILANNICENN